MGDCVIIKLSENTSGVENVNKNKMKILCGVLSICLITPIFQHINANASRDRTLDQMITDSFVIVEEDGSTRTVQLESVASDEKEVSVEDKYEVIDNIGGEVVETYASEEEAIVAANLLEEEENEDVTVQAFDLRAVTYGIVYINTTSVTEYTMVETGQTGYISGAYGRDGAYIGTYNGKIRAKVAGVVADFDASDVDVVTFDGSNPTSYYIEENGYLYHYYLYGSDKVYSSTRVGYDLDYLSSGVKYYSYDGHYFYDSYSKMIQDYQSGTYTKAVNVNNPYYNYYQYLSHRSTTSLTGTDLDNISQSVLSSASYQTSKFYNIGSSFITNQDKYYVNALLMFGVAANESNWGRSTIAQDKNNLFGHGAYDSNPYWGSNGYSSAAASVEYHAYYFVSRGYLDYGDWRHFGPNLGDKESGLNVKYASDPYWGEKAACRAYYLDYVPSDYGTETIGIIEGAISSCKLYNEPSTSSTVITTLTNLSNLPVLILDEVVSNGTTWYKIASDTSLNSTRTAHDYSLIYDVSKDYLYIEASKVRVVWEGTSDDSSTDDSITIPSLDSGHNIVIKDGNLVTESKTTVADIKAIDASAVVKNGSTTISDTSSLVGTGYTVTINNKTYTIIKLGDVNGDGKINSGDLFTIQKYLLGKSEFTSVQIKSADVNNDGKINSGDLFNVQKHLIKKTELSL